MIATPKVTLIASTTFAPGHENQVAGRMGVEPGVGDMDSLVEFAGRSCYESFHRPNAKTATNAGYMANILQQGHGSVLEHASATFYITGVSRAFSHEIVRHRHLNFSQISQRFVDESEANIVVPPAIRDNDGAVMILEEVMDDVAPAYQDLATYLVDKGLPRKQAREAARAVLPNMTEVRMVITGNLRAWRDVLTRRLAPGADAEMREVANLICTELEAIAPHSMQGVRETAAADN